nr:hypothetical protein [Tanacetum cinerariifolium]
GSGEAITGGPVTVQGCSHKTFMNGKPHAFNGTEGVVGLRRWIEKVKQVFEICKCAEEDKVMFAAITFEGRALTWWNRNVHTLGLVNANRIPWTEFKSMMTTEYFPATEIQRMEQELWTLTLKGDDIEAYNNHLHELALMCPDLVPNEKKKIERQETARAYATAPVEGKTYAGNLPKCNRCNLHHIGHCPPKYRRCQKLGHIEADCRTRLPGTDENLIRNIVRIPLPNGEILEIHGERPEKDSKSLSCIKADEVRLDDIHTLCDFPEVFPDDLIGLHPVREIEFRIDLIPGALPVVKSPYRLAP